jgi:peptidyl-prolyl cis-trans isomerase C
MAPSPAGQVKADTVVVTVDGSPITEGRVQDRIMMELRRRYGPNVARFTPQMLEQARSMMQAQVTDWLISETLLDNQVKAAHITVTDEDIVAAVNTEGATWNPPMTFEQYKKTAIDRGADFNDVMAQLRTNVPRQKLLEAQWAGKIDVNDAQARAYYDAHPEEFEKQAQVRASHILIAPDPNVDPNEGRIAAKQKAEKLLGQIKEGADFAELAKANSDDPVSAAEGGDLDFFGRDQMVKPFEDAAFALEPNQVSDVIETQYGYHIIKVTDRKEASVVPFEEANASIITELTNQKKAEIANEYMQSLRDKATIVYTQTAPSDTNVPEAVPAPAAAEPKPAADANSVE